MDWMDWMDMVGWSNEIGTHKGKNVTDCLSVKVTSREAIASKNKHNNNNNRVY